MSEENHDFDGKGLDEIVQLSQVDNDHAPEIREQARAAADLYHLVTAAITEITKAADNISAAEWGAVGAAFDGKAGNATRQTVKKLSEATDSAHKAMEPQSAVFAELADRAEGTHRQISQLRTDRDHWLRILAENPKDPKLNQEFGRWFGDADPKDLEREIRRRYDSDAREKMSTVTSGYLTEVDRLRTVGSYHGPRTSRPDADGERYHPGAEYHPGPRLHPDGPRSSDSPSGTGPAVHHAPPVEGGSSAQPDLQSGAPAPHAPGPVGTAPPSDVFVPNKPVVPPVIGSRPGPGSTTPSTVPSRQTGGLSRPVIGGRSAPSPGSSPNRQPSGVTRPVIGGRSAPSATTSPSRQPNGLTRPVIGSRPGAAGNPPTNARSGSPATRSAPTRQHGGLSRPVIGARPNPTTSTGSTAANRPGQTGGGIRPGSTPFRSTPSRQPGVRSNPAATPTTGASARQTGGLPKSGIGGRSGSHGSVGPAARTGMQADAVGSQRIQGKQKPGVRGGSGPADTAPRGRVIGRASVPPPSARTRRPPDSDTAPNPQAEWYPASATVPAVIRGAQEEPAEVEVDPGEHLTRDNLGKNRGIRDEHR